MLLEAGFCEWPRRTEGSEETRVHLRLTQRAGEKNLTGTCAESWFMNLDLLSFFTLVLGLAAGTALGWFLGSRPVPEWRERFAARDLDAKELDEKFRRAITELAGASERAGRADEYAERAEELARRLEQVRSEHTAQLETVRLARDQVLHEKAGIAADLSALKADAANFAEQKRLLLEAQEALRKEFENAGNRVLEKAQETFLARAQDRFAQSEKANAERIAAVLAPVGQRLQRYEEQVAGLEAKRVDAFGQLFGQIEALRAGQEQVRAEAQRLGNSLTNAPKARGRWGERALQNVLEQCGLTEHTDFVTEHSVNTEDGRLRPDAIIRIPGQKSLIIDAKVSLNAYQEAFEANDDGVRKVALDQHARSMRNHVQTLGTKSYQSQFDEAPDYVVMFVPGEHFVAAALEHDPELWDFAFRNKVLLATPTNLVAIARTVAMIWTQDKLAREAAAIGKLGTELYDRIATAGEHLKGVGVGLDRAVRKYNDFVGSFDRNVLSSARKLREKGIEVGKREVEDIPLIESLPRHADPVEPDALPIPETE
jgi:DNA recombination protein RmuC